MTELEKELRNLLERFECETLRWKGIAKANPEGEAHVRAMAKVERLSYVNMHIHHLLRDHGEGERLEASGEASATQL